MFDKEIYFLGVKCLRNHVYSDDKSLRYIKGHACAQCKKPVDSKFNCRHDSEFKKKPPQTKEIKKQKIRDCNSKPEARMRRSLAEKLRRQNDPAYRIKGNLKSRLNKILKGSEFGKKFENILGYNSTQLKQRLEETFSEGMNWGNYGFSKGYDKWCIDHIIPDSLFNYCSMECEGFKKSWALSNLQAKWCGDNFSKQARFEG
jgi:hypothetical protein